MEVLSREIVEQVAMIMGEGSAASQALRYADSAPGETFFVRDADAGTIVVYRASESPN